VGAGGSVVAATLGMIVDTPTDVVVEVALPAELVDGEAPLWSGAGVEQPAAKAPKQVSTRQNPDFRIWVDRDLLAIE
jgi:hypothetical protein